MTAILRRFGYVASSDPLYRAGRTLGRLERSIFLCDVLTSNDFRRELHRDLSHGEAVHSLQRKIYQGGMGAKRGRRSEEMHCCVFVKSLPGQSRDGSGFSGWYGSSIDIKGLPEAPERSLVP